jgi:general secretion pathway protein L
MSDIVVIYPDMGMEAPLLWGRFAEGRLRQSGRAALEEAAPHMAGAECWFVAPGMDVTLHRVEMPARSGSKARAMLPFLLEDDMATGLADMHLALGPAGEGGRLVAVVSKARMEGWLAALNAHGLTPHRMAPDYLCIAPAEEAQALAIGGHVIARLADGGGFAAEADMARLLLGEAGHMVAPQPVAEAAALECFHARLPGAGIDLLQGGYEPRHALDVDIRAFRRTAIIAGMAAASYMALMLSQGWWYGHQADILDGQTETVLRQVFPDIGRVVNAGAQMQARLNTLKGGSSGQFLQLSRMLAGGIDGVPNATIRNLRYDDGRSELAAEMAYADFEDMDKVKAAIAAQGGRIEEGGSRNNGDGMIGDITMRMP